MEQLVVVPGTLYDCCCLPRHSSHQWLAADLHHLVQFCIVCRQSTAYASFHCLSLQILLSLLQEPGGYGLLKEVNELGGTHKPAHGIAKLMEWVAAGESWGEQQQATAAAGRHGLGRPCAQVQGGAVCMAGVTKTTLVCTAAVCSYIATHQNLQLLHCLGCFVCACVLTAGERQAAVQPAGLTVQLHPYQLQSLAFMQEAEQWEGGWRHLLWKWLPPTPMHHQQQQQAGPSSSAAAAAATGGAIVPSRAGVGPGVWWSPVLGRVSSSVPAAPWGGFLAEEMVSFGKGCVPGGFAGGGADRGMSGGTRGCQLCASSSLGRLPGRRDSECILGSPGVEIGGWHLDDSASK